MAWEQKPMSLSLDRAKAIFDEAKATRTEELLRIKMAERSERWEKLKIELGFGPVIPGAPPHPVFAAMAAWDAKPKRLCD